MKKFQTNLLAGLVSSLATLNASAQIFSSGSDGSDGPLVITNDTMLIVRSNGIYHHTTIYVASAATLRFVKSTNTSFTPVYLLATSNVVIDGIIDVSGQGGGLGGPGGFDGGVPGFDQIGLLPSDGLGPGGGKTDGRMSSVAGCGSYATVGDPGSGTNGGGSIYGNRLVMPLIGGSGGGGSTGGPGTVGGGGGGAILIASSSSVTIAGALKANGGNGAYYFGNYTSRSGAGSGGAIRIVAPEISGSGSMFTGGGFGGGGSGWIRLDTYFRRPIGFSFYGVSSAGSLMQVFPSVPARLSIVEAAGQNIPEGQTAPVTVNLPLGSSTNQTVTVLAREFVGTVPISLVLTPESGPSTKYDTVIDMSLTNVVTVPVVIPVNTLTRIHVWSR